MVGRCRQSTLVLRRESAGRTGASLGGGGRRCQPKIGAGDCGVVPKRQRPQPLNEGGQPQIQGESGKRCKDPVAVQDQLEWIEGNRDLTEPFTLGCREK